MAAAPATTPSPAPAPPAAPAPSPTPTPSTPATKPMKWYWIVLIIIVALYIGSKSREVREVNLYGASAGIPAHAPTTPATPGYEQYVTVDLYHLERIDRTKPATGRTGQWSPSPQTGNKWATMINGSMEYHETLEDANEYLADFGWRIMPGAPAPRISSQPSAVRSFNTSSGGIDGDGPLSVILRSLGALWNSLW